MSNSRVCPTRYEDDQRLASLKKEPNELLVNRKQGQI
jgi:hypothetical protein